jgi:hypothetical protein
MEKSGVQDRIKNEVEFLYLLKQESKRKLDKYNKNIEYALI